MAQALWTFTEEVCVPGHADWEGNSRTRRGSSKMLSIHLKMPGSQPDHKKPRPGGQGEEAQIMAQQSKPDLIKSSLTPGVLTRRECAKGGTLVYLPCSSLSENACPFSQVTSSPTKSSRVFILLPPILESQHASVCREQDTVMVTARQPAGFRPSLLPAAAPQETCRGLAISYPLSAGIAEFLSPGKLGEKIRLANEHFQKKVEAVGTERDHRTAA